MELTDVTEAAGLAGAGLLFRVMRPRYGMLPASLGLVVVLFLPSLFYASISVLKEPLYFLASSTCIAAAIITIQKVAPARIRDGSAPGLGERKSPWRAANRSRCARWQIPRTSS